MANPLPDQSSTVELRHFDAQVRRALVAEAERDRYRRALEHIREHEGKVCDEYEVCAHRACQSSYGAWSIADGALGCTDSRALDEFQLSEEENHG